jgi:hypothetical protein
MSPEYELWQKLYLARLDQSLNPLLLLHSFRLFPPLHVVVNERVDYAVESYLHKNRPLILTSTNQARVDINQQIRAKIDNPNPEHLLTIKESKQIKASNAYFSESYEIDDIISINGSIPNFKRGEQGKVIFMDAYPVEKFKLVLDIMNPHYWQTVICFVRILIFLIGRWRNNHRNRGKWKSEIVNCLLAL